MSSTHQVKAPSATPNNADLLVYACYLAGGFEKWLDVEDLFLKAFELAPARLSWRTKPDIPDYKKISKALQELEDPKRSDHLGLLDKKGKYERKLSVLGLDWCRQYESLLNSLYGGERVVPTAAIQDSSRLLRHVENSQAFSEFKLTRTVTSEKWTLAEALRCLPDSAPHVWRGRIDQVQSAAEKNGRSDLVEFARSIRSNLDRSQLSQ